MLEEKSSSPSQAAAGRNSSIEQTSTEMPVKDEFKSSALHGELNETIVSIGKISGKLDELTTLMKEQFQRLKTVEQTIHVMENKMVICDLFRNYFSFLFDSRLMCFNLE